MQNLFLDLPILSFAYAAVMVVRFSFVIKGIKETLEWFQLDCILLFSVSLSFNRRFLYAKQSVLVFDVS